MRRWTKWHKCPAEPGEATLVPPVQVDTETVALRDGSSAVLQ